MFLPLQVFTVEKHAALRAKTNTGTLYVQPHSIVIQNELNSEQIIRIHKLVQSICQTFNLKILRNYAIKLRQR